MRIVIAATAAILLTASAPAFAQTAGTAGMSGTSSGGAMSATHHRMHEGRAAGTNMKGKGPEGSAAIGGGLSDAKRNNGQ